MNAGKQRRGRGDDPREGDLRQQLGVVQRGCRCRPARSTRSTSRCRTRAGRTRSTTRPSMSTSAEAVEEDRERQRADERLDPRPRDAEERLLVADLEVAQGEEVDQLAVRPELAQLQRRPPTTRRGVDHPRSGADLLPVTAIAGPSLPAASHRVRTAAPGTSL